MPTDSAQTSIGSLVAVTFRFESAGGICLFLLFFVCEILQYEYLGEPRACTYTQLHAS